MGVAWGHSITGETGGLSEAHKGSTTIYLLQNHVETRLGRVISDIWPVLLHAFPCNKLSNIAPSPVGGRPVGQRAPRTEPRGPVRDAGTRQPPHRESPGNKKGGGAEAPSPQTCVCREGLVLVLLDAAHDGLVDLHDRDDQECQAKGGAKGLHRELHEAEHLGEERDLNDDDGEDEREDGGAPEPLVLLLHAEQRLATAAHVEAVEDLHHGERQERHRSSVGAVHKFPDAAFHVMSYNIGNHHKNREPVHLPLLL